MPPAPARAAHLTGPADSPFRVRTYPQVGTVRAPCLRLGATEAPRKPHGGYRLIPLVLLALAWWAYKNRRIRLADLRVFFAIHEMAARRCCAPLDRPQRFGLQELLRLTGLASIVMASLFTVPRAVKS